MLLNWDLPVAEDREKRRLSGSVFADQAVPLAARQLKLCVVKKLDAVKRDGEIVDLDVAGHWVNAQHAGTGSGLRGKGGLFF